MCVYCVEREREKKRERERKKSGRGGRRELFIVYTLKYCYYDDVDAFPGPTGVKLPLRGRLVPSLVS